jgi:hypothetical protein
VPHLRQSEEPKLMIRDLAIREAYGAEALALELGD